MELPELPEPTVERLAKEAGLDTYADHLHCYETNTAQMSVAAKFAALVAREAALAERERCARLCEQQIEGYTAREMLTADVAWEAGTIGEIEMAGRCAAAIRDEGENR